MSIIFTLDRVRMRRLAFRTRSVLPGMVPASQMAPPSLPIFTRAD